jgi:hypothetical protein
VIRSRAALDLARDMRMRSIARVRHTSSRLQQLHDWHGPVRERETNPR